MAEGLSEIQFRRTVMRIRTVALTLVSILPFAGAIAARADTPSPLVAMGRPVHVVLVNMSGQHRQLRLTSGVIDLPCGVWVSVDSRVGATLTIVSDTKASVDEEIAVKREDDALILRIQ